MCDRETGTEHRVAKARRTSEGSDGKGEGEIQLEKVKIQQEAAVGKPRKK